MFPLVPLDHYPCCGEQKCVPSNACRRRRTSESEEDKSRGAFLVTIPSPPGIETTNNRSGWGQAYC